MPATVGATVAPARTGGDDDRLVCTLRNRLFSIVSKFLKSYIFMRAGDVTVSISFLHFATPIIKRLAQHFPLGHS